MRDALETVGVCLLLVGLVLIGCVGAVLLVLLIMAVVAAPFMGVALGILLPLSWFGVI